MDEDSKSKLLVFLLLSVVANVVLFFLDASIIENIILFLIFMLIPKFISPKYEYDIIYFFIMIYNIDNFFYNIYVFIGYHITNFNILIFIFFLLNEVGLLLSGIICGKYMIETYELRKGK